MSKASKSIGIVAGIAAIGLFGASASAQQGPGPGYGPMGMGHGMKMNGMAQGGMGPGEMGKGPMMGNFGDPASRLSILKVELGIRPEQTAAWDAYAKVVTETSAERRNHAQHIDPGAMRNMQPADRQQHFTTMQAQRQAAQAKVNAAAEALAAKLDDTQRAKARSSLPGLATASPGMRFGMRGGHSAGQGPGPSMGPPWAR